MLSEVEGERGALPLLAFAAAQLWEKRDRERNFLTRHAYEESGRVGGALARHADAVVDGIGASSLPMVRELFPNLVTGQGTRASREVRELLAIFPKEEDRRSAEEVLRRLVAARLLTSYETSVEIIHESLLTAWPRLVRWQTQELEEELDWGRTEVRAPWGRRVAGSLWLSALALGVVLAVGVTYWLLRPRQAERADSRPKRVSFDQVTSEAGQESYPSLSPDEAFVVYAKLASGNWDIFRRRLGGRRAFNLTEDSGADDIEPAFSPDGEQIAFRSERDGGGIYLMGATGESVRRLTDFGYNPGWSPDGRRLVISTQKFTHPLIGPAGDVRQLWTVDVATGDKRLVIG
jgi:Novel STAND NTPase 1/WD40-like Beta Propeller Repeat